MTRHDHLPASFRQRITGGWLYNVEQSSPEWAELRRGIPTASEFDNIVTPGGKPSGSRAKYMGRLIAEELLGEYKMSLDTLEWVERGKLLEPKAAKAFEFDHDCETTILGFLTTHDGRWGASLDRAFLGGILEIKCPKSSTHFAYYVDGFGPAYKVQVQGQLLVADVEVAIRYSYHPACGPVEEITYRDEKFIATLRSELTRFSDELGEHLLALRATGMYPERPPLQMPVDVAYADNEDIDGIADRMGCGNVRAG